MLTRYPSSHTQRKYVVRLEDLREALENSPFFKTHEVRDLGARCMWAPVWGLAKGIGEDVGSMRSNGCSGSED